MFFKKIIFVFFLLFLSANLLAQKDSINNVINTKELKKIDRKLKRQQRKLKKQQGVYNPLSPSKAAFYSAIFPGMGQAYNKKYWKIPIAWGMVAIPAYYYQINNSDYRRFRNAYRLRKAGLPDEFTENGVELLSTETLERAQEQLRENRDMSLLTGVILYILQIVEASVNAHLLQFNTSDDLTFKPVMIQNPINLEAPSVGLRIKYTF
ncbi:DUF5683 domain-containing protein [Polaribacter porphyrae]|uniref:DUF5683 domain-containing protein n=1 Tax=Polaribacter porphyrae TaxID=1137780 RepID=A0A2S7WNK5_9FLAO|nr:DUF5683 domain-containing protein [Polaribacter porphyrae]PQJ79036.1 hypothetical protein BTO18_07565 [Polaribacter porphyrae]